ncbi:GlxA family transcriptional regulator [Gordonia soli]|uniref:Putative AraC family transcriptional regulator n=1 Tax=Gordonia soli NBRC 108243 TaxID=1223545 RepID=M0QKE8_9ACTN|nr:helix-turn-helix domain-containing protein [Gordonia soli]GAC69120.1 putative AraC family transcriptional regulator [Gordonia soli NBRC 108243]
MHRVVTLVRSVQSTFELGCAVEVFGTERAGIPTHYELTMCTETPGRVTTAAGYSIDVPTGLDALETADTIIVPGWLPVDVPPTPRVIAALRRAHHRGARLVTICSGVFALAHTGLLDGRSATTHESRIGLLQKMFPAVRVVETLFVDHGDVATSAGAGAGIELCLHLVEHDHGAAYAAAIARSMVVPRRARPTTTRPDGRPASGIASAEAWIDAHLPDRLSVADLATHLSVSPRTLARRCADELGVAPGEWIVSRRVRAAQALLERTDLTVDAIATRVGLGSAVNLRRRFHTHVGVTPSDYRRSIRAA